MQIVTISKKEYDRLKQIEEEMALDSQIRESVEDIKNDRVTWS